MTKLLRRGNTLAVASGIGIPKMKGVAGNYS